MYWWEREIPGELQHRLMVTDLVKKKVVVVRKEAIERRKVWKLKYVGRRKGGEIKETHGGETRT